MYLLIRLFIITLVLFSCSHYGKKTYHSDTLFVDVGGEPTTFDPALASDAQTFRVLNDLYSGLVDYNQKNEIISGLAKSWDITPDKKTYTFHLRNDIKFSDGSAITSKDFAFSFRRVVDPKTASPYNYLLNDIVNAQEIMKGTKPNAELGVETPDKLTFIIKLKKPNLNFLSYLTLPAAYVVSENAILKYNDSWANLNNIVTSGAYNLLEHVLNGYILLEKNKYYYNANNVHIKYVKFYPLIDTNVSLSSFKTDVLDFTWKNIPVDEYKYVKEQFASQLHTTLSERMDFLFFNFRLAKYQDVNLRKALTLAINRDEIAYKVLNAGQVPLYSVVTSSIDGGKYKNNIYQWKLLTNDQRIAEAKRLYLLAGYNNKNPLHLTISYYANDENKKISLAIASMLQNILGVDVQLKMQELRVWLSDGFKGDFDLRLSSWGADYNIVNTYTILYQCNNSNNMSAYCNKNYDDMINQAAITDDLTIQNQLNSKAIEMVMSDYVIIPLIQPSLQRLINSRVKNIDFEHNYLDNVQSKWFNFN